MTMQSNQHSIFAAAGKAAQPHVHILQIYSPNHNSPASSIKRQASSVKHQASSIKRQASSVNIKRQASSVKHQASSINSIIIPAQEVLSTEFTPQSIPSAPRFPRCPLTYGYISMLCYCILHCSIRY
ncbi:hypothetical protein L211DRAFT_11527 [Terfezia boudieri ATCC MYA-4762]|uniref:Uncharacterized protein n=1 Tax=Terfezia boudieri ATCC MYA-4762 TaxID=1051890 RepID=A0A3N4MA74_9PEZI|nr:hypothetical protein L211DRAFT_11527 [Terfezia boudieri ATCC MYA-4762]